MQVFHTDGVPPSSGSNNFPNIGCTENNNSALRNKVIAKVMVDNKVLCLIVMRALKIMIESINMVRLISQQIFAKYTSARNFKK
jgi:hypothetical protein